MERNEQVLKQEVLQQMKQDAEEDFKKTVRSKIGTIAAAQKIIKEQMLVVEKAKKELNELKLEPIDEAALT